ncbi:unnamed protein product [Rangifer tarandus platyrhynchus]|uniref:Uncharacterized protein n=2 Tax=Rangifer tarandus platyrhynchus TaxID=3082113 RepID=A0ABN8ZLV1_RANTA|nr:unnamed protein product [Rangifer tarandus platyrhynchus]CAI9706533.1 unnamed protein product [Rangifer tarandus platyrhynchus]
MFLNCLIVLLCFNFSCLCCVTNTKMQSTNLFPQKGELRAVLTEPASNRWPAGRNLQRSRRRRLDSGPRGLPNSVQPLPAAHTPSGGHAPSLLPQAPASRRPEVPHHLPAPRFRSAPRASAQAGKHREKHVPLLEASSPGRELPPGLHEPCRWSHIYLSKQAPKLLDAAEWPGPL